MPAPIVVDLTPAVGPASEQRALLQACSEAVTPEVCAYAVPGQDAHARVRWLDGSTALVWVIDGERQHSVRLTFTPADDAEQRWRTVGLAVASLIAERRNPAQKKPAVKPSRRAAPIETPSATESSGESQPSPPVGAPAAPSFSAAAGFLGGPGLSEGAWRWGPWLNLGYQRPEWPLGVSGEVRVSWRGQAQNGLSNSWYTASLGVFMGWRLTPRLGLQARLAIAREWFTSSAEQRDGHAADQATRAYLSTELAVSGHVALSDRLGLLLGSSVSTTPGQPVSLRGESVGKNPGLFPAVRGGLHYSW